MELTKVIDNLFFFIKWVYLVIQETVMAADPNRSRNYLKSNLSNLVHQLLEPIPSSLQLHLPGNHMRFVSFNTPLHETTPVTFTTGVTQLQDSCVIYNAGIDPFYRHHSEMTVRTQEWLRLFLFIFTPVFVNGILKEEIELKWL